MRDLSMKYHDIEKDFPNRAGKLRQVLETQKRLIETLMRDKQSEDVKALLSSVGEGYDVGKELLDYTFNIIQGVANDASALREGSEIRMINKMQALDIRRNWEKLEEMTALIVEIKALKRKYEPA